MKRFDSINVIPFIDIMLVLLVIVLTTASFVATNKLNIKVPGSSAKESLSTNEKVIELAINSESVIFYNGKKTGINELEFVLTKLDKATAIDLRVDEKVNFGQFVKVLDLFKRLQLEKFSIITEQIATPSANKASQ